MEAMLRSNERRCVNACGRYINLKSLKGEVWTLRDEARELSALVVHARQGLLPVRREKAFLPAPRFLRGLFGTLPVHSLQGKKADVLLMETGMEKIGLFATEKIDYDLMCIDGPPRGFCSAGPAGLTVRKPRVSDVDGLVELHAAYEKEEVLSEGGKFNPAVGRLRLEQIFANEQMLVAEIDGRLIGKINTNAVAFTRFQVGGVYVRPGYRGLGVARKMAGEFVAGLVAQGKGVSLFVKKTNPAARSVYRGIGFDVLDNYRINYYRKG